MLFLQISAFFIYYAFLNYLLHIMTLTHKVSAGFGVDAMIVIKYNFPFDSALILAQLECLSG